MEFPRDPACALCDLSSTGCRTICIPMRPWGRDVAVTQPVPPKAVLFLGAYPGHQEDLHGRSFVGDTGAVLDGWLKACRWAGLADPYLTNALRCRLPGKASPTQKQFKGCREWLLRDIELLQSIYSQVVVVALGADSAKALGFGSLQKLLNAQGRSVQITLGDGSRSVTVPVWGTYQPAATLPSRQPALVHAVLDHLRTFMGWLSGQTLQITQVTPTSLAKWKPSNTDLSPVGVDIETYGILEGHTQTHWVPRLSILADKIPRDQLIQSIAVATKEGGALRSYSCETHTSIGWNRLVDRANSAGGRPWVFMNAPFDVSYLMERGLPGLIPFRTPIEDISVWNNMMSDVRPERSLKAQARLRGVTDYSVTKNPDGSFKQYTRADDPEALSYNERDARATLALRDLHRSDIASMYGKDSPKLSEYTRQFYSDVLWCCTLMQRNGVKFRRGALRAAMEASHLKAQQALEQAQSEFGIKIAGKGSQSHVQNLIEEAVTKAGLWDSKDLAWTDKTNKVSTGVENVELALYALAPGEHPELVDALGLLQTHKTSSKLVNTYYGPLLEHTRWDSRAYPKWFPVPSYVESLKVSGGTKQARITCSGPGLQTMPKVVFECLGPTYPGGVLLKIDLSQIELRVAAIVSGDPRMLQEYRDGIDRHTNRALEVFGPAIKDHPQFKDLYRQAAKQFNFAIIYQAAPPTLRATLRRELGWHIPIGEAIRIHRAANSAYPHYAQWVNSHIAQCAKQGWVGDPILGQSRLILRSQGVAEEDYRAMLVNCPIQMAAANILLDVQRGFMKWLHEEFEAHPQPPMVVLNVYDALIIDAPAGLSEELEKKFGELLTNSSYRGKLEQYHGRAVPITYEASLM